MYEEGLYVGRVLSQAFGESKDKGTPYFSLTTLPLRRKLPGSEEYEDVSGQQRTVFMYLTEGTAEMVAEQLRSIGFDGSKFEDLDPANEGHHSFVGEEIPLWCSIEEYKGKKNDKWSVSNGGGGGLQHKGLERGKLSRLNALFGKHLKAAGAAGKGEARRAPAGANRAAKDDDIPF